VQGRWRQLVSYLPRHLQHAQPHLTSHIHRSYFSALSSSEESSSQFRPISSNSQHSFRETFSAHRFLAIMAALEEDESIPFLSPELPQDDNPPPLFSASKAQKVLGKALLVSFACVILYCSYTMLFDNILMLSALSSSQSTALPASKDSPPCPSSTESVPDYFQTTLQLWAGPTATGRAPFLAQTNPVSFAPTATFVPNDPLETAMPIVGQSQNQSIFQLMGQLSPYFPNPIGFGVAEYPLPPGANITQVQVSYCFV
jgi:hypothetical protein